MPVDDGALLRGERSGFLENRVGNADLADVMQQRGDFYLVQAVFWDVQFSRHPNRPLCQPSTMDAGAEVLQVKQLVEGADHRVAERGVMLFQFLDAHQQQRSFGVGDKRATHIRSKLVDQYVWHACTARYVSRRPYPN